VTEKKQRILDAAIQLFTESGYNASSTSKVAKRAGVSEGLIFRHFGNKEGLLDVILEEGQKILNPVINDLMAESNPKEVIRKAIGLPFAFHEKNFKFWQMQMRLQWELGQFNNDVAKELFNALYSAFKSLDYPYPHLEAQYLLYCFQGMREAMIKGEIDNINEMQQFLLKKYGI
jgi:AcrR family transcriptional regulator